MPGFLIPLVRNHAGAVACTFLNQIGERLRRHLLSRLRLMVYARLPAHNRHGGGVVHAQPGDVVERFVNQVR